ncbi:transcriptional regulator TetR family [Klebsiella michiganensis]|uniref:Transcriptional regulator TetR family n=1 Tax=Klebsiella michiganensis TaxID=1134687 RepID=A0A7H4LSR5_9ENTR|nr:transcriptional regulator TetR family [Klebsiella michiganensis]
MSPPAILHKSLIFQGAHIYHYYSNWEALKKSAIKYMFDNDIEECHATFNASESMSPTDRVRLYIKTLLPDAPSAHWLLYLELWPMAARDGDYANLVHKSITPMDQYTRRNHRLRN